eukprot:GHVS01061905.1.p1 GENE.GHVS01061905.1~~GHVS01061905.1.p1  ORF type:complete len:481 (+),score=64.49 GHVS01061905.1:233-1675(+)
MGAGQSDANGGFRIFKVSRNSPAERAGLEVFFDYIVEIDDLQVIHASEESQRSFFEKVQQCVNQQIKLVVYNMRTKQFRDVYVTPAKWGGSGLLGATVRYDTFESAGTQGVRVLDVFTNSPAALAGLVPYSDYILGTADIAFKDLDELIESVSTHVGRQLSLYVYNSETETLRELLIVPSYQWGGQGCLGCDIGVGFIHRVPRSRHAATEPSNADSHAFKQPYVQSGSVHTHQPNYTQEHMQAPQVPVYQQLPPTRPPTTYVSSATPDCPQANSGKGREGGSWMEERETWSDPRQLPPVHTVGHTPYTTGMFSTQGSPHPSPPTPPPNNRPVHTAVHPGVHTGVHPGVHTGVHTDMYAGARHSPTSNHSPTVQQGRVPNEYRTENTTCAQGTSAHGACAQGTSAHGACAQGTSAQERGEGEEGKSVASLFMQESQQMTGGPSYTLSAPAENYAHGNQSSVMTVIPGPPRPGVFYPSPSFA